MRKIIWVKEARSNSEEEVVVPKKRIIRIRSEEKVVTSKSEEKAAPEKGKCIHGKNRNGYHCKQCPGKGICEHNRRKYRCVECKGPAICIHNKQKCKCVECEGSSICIHRKIKYTCVECKGSSICQHNRRKYICVLCNGNGICEHKRVKSQCSLCHGGAICIHNNRKCRCKICKGSTICIHDRQKYRCFDCQGSSICEHQRMKSRCKDCRRALPIEESLKRYKHACVICGANLNSSTQKLNRLCSDHLTPDTKRVEVVWREIIQEEFIFPPSTIDEPVYTDACKRGKYRPDLSYHTSNLVINLELDEHCHSSYDPDCELKRLVNMKDACN